MPNDNLLPPSTPRKIYLKEPLNPNNFVTPHGHTVSSYVSQDFVRINFNDFVKELGDKKIELVDLKERTIIPLDAFLKGMGASENALHANDESISAIASDDEVLQLRNTYCTMPGVETLRYGPFCEFANFIISKFTSGLILFTRNDPRALKSPYTIGGLKPDVLAFNVDFPAVANDKWRGYSVRGPSKDATWEWGDMKFFSEFKKHKDRFLPKPEEQHLTFSPPPKQLITELRAASKRPKKSTKSARASAHGSSHASNASSKRKSTGKATPPVSIPHSASASASGKQGGSRKSSGKGTPAASASHTTSTSGAKKRVAPPALPDDTAPGPPQSTSASEAKRRKLEKMMAEDDWVDDVEVKSELGDEAKVERVRRVLEVDGAKYAIDLVSSVPSRRHVFALLVFDDSIRLAYYDRAGPVYSGTLYFTQDVYRFVLLLKRLAEMDRWETGLIEDLVEAEGPIEEIEDALLTEGGGSQAEQVSELAVGIPASTSAPITSPDLPSGQDDAEAIRHGLGGIVYPGVVEALEIIRSGNHLFTLRFSSDTVAYLIMEIGGRRPYGLISRGTSVYLCYLISPERKGLFALKLSWPQARRDSEVHILKLAREALREHDADPKFRQEYGDRKLEESIPFVVTAKDLDDLKKEQSFRWATQGFYEHFDEASNRIYRAIAMELLFHLYSVTRLDHFKDAVRDLVLVHHYLYHSKHRILHRDISLNNLMVRFYDGGTKVKGVLIDFDLASLGEPKPEGHRGRRTGTRPYMARDLLLAETPVHLERFDWESFFYIICWIASHYSNGDEVETDAFNEWDELDNRKLRDIKVSLISGLRKPSLEYFFTDFFEPIISSWVRPLQRMFLVADLAKQDFDDSKKAKPEDDTLVFDDATGGGHLTWEKYWGIFRL